MNLTDALDRLDNEVRIWGEDPELRQVMADISLAVSHARRMADLEARVDAGAEIWAMSRCEHGFAVAHRWGGSPADPEWNEFPDFPNECPGGERERLMG